MSLRRFVIASALMTLLLGTACSDGGGNGDGSSTPTRTASVSLKGLAFSPATVSIAAGGSVTWTDDEAVEHTVTAGTPEAPEKARFHEVLMNAQTFSFTFAEPGTYRYFCERHPTNMQGTVTVR